MKLKIMHSIINVNKIYFLNNDENVISNEIDDKNVISNKIDDKPKQVNLLDLNKDILILLVFL